MKNELKQLYKKDKKLALEVAKVLGYRINAKEDVKQVLSRVKRAVNAIEKLYPTLIKNAEIAENISFEHKELQQLFRSTSELKEAIEMVNSAISRSKKALQQLKN